MGLPAEGGLFRKLSGRIITLFAIIVAWVFFRANTTDSAIAMLESMFGANGSLLPDQIINFIKPLHYLADGAGQVPFLADQSVMGTIAMGALLMFGFVIVSFAPNLFQLSLNHRLFLVVPSFAFTIQKVYFAGASSSFLYFRF